MGELRFEVSEDVERALETERQLLGFESLSAYVAWIVERRTAVSGETSGGADPEDVRVDDEDDDQTAVTTSVTAAADGDVEGNLDPGTVRIPDDSVADLADELRGVEGQRVDAIASQAVARTRERHGDVGTGLDYDSTAVLGADGARPGSDLADLDDLAVPGRETDLVERRREAVGAALAHLRDVGSARRSDFLDLYEEYPAGYDSADGWWRCVKRGLRQVDRVDAADSDSRVWAFDDRPGRVRRVRD
jgi:hypothetical protein